MTQSPYTLALQPGRHPRTYDPIIVLLNDRITGTPGQAHDRALAILALALGINPETRGLPHLSTLTHLSTEHLLIHPWRYPVGSWMATTRGLWSQPTDATVTTTNGVYGIACGAQAWQKAEEFRLPIKHQYDLRCIERDWNSPWWDSIALGLVLGALDVRLPMAFLPTQGEQPMIARDWMYAIVGSAARVLHPWLGNPRIPTRGYDSRAFPLKASVQRALDTLPDLICPIDGFTTTIHAHFKTNSPINSLGTMGIVRPNAPYAPTAWEKGPNWDKALARFDAHILDAGRAIAAQLPDRFDRSPTDILERTATGTGHARLAQIYPLKQPDAVLAQRLPAYKRGRKPRQQDTP